MASSRLTDEQVIALINELSPERKRAILVILAADAGPRREERRDYAETQLRRLCAERGLDWDAMSEDEREAFVDDLVHEDRQCRT